MNFFHSASGEVYSLTNNSSTVYSIIKDDYDYKTTLERFENIPPLLTTFSLHDDMTFSHVTSPSFNQNFYQDWLFQYNSSFLLTLVTYKGDTFNTNHRKKYTKSTVFPVLYYRQKIIHDFNAYKTRKEKEVDIITCPNMGCFTI